MNNLQEKVIRAMVDMYGFYSIEELSEMTEISISSIKRSLKDITKFIEDYDGKLLRVPKKGICMVVTDQQRENILEALDSYANGNPESFYYRKNYILDILFNYPANYTVQLFSEELCVSRKMIEKDLKMIEEYLATFHLELSKVQNQGISIVGREFDIRQAIVDTQNKKYWKHTYIEELPQELDYRISKRAFTYFSDYYSKEDIMMVQEYLADSEAELGVVLVDISFCRLTEYLLLTKRRMEEGNKIRNKADRTMAKLVDIQGRFPCEPDNKKPTLIKKWEYSTALYPPNNAFTSDNTFTLVTTDTFMLGIYELGPGGVFAPLDIHPGDESYYILNGPVVQRSGNGQFAYLETGEGLFMPEGAWHCCHNFSDQKTRILYFITPKAWDEHIPPAVIPTEEETKLYKGPNNDNLPDMRGAIKDISRQGCTDDIGCWPVDPAEARKTGAVYAVRDFEKLNNVHGTTHPMLLRFITSNDYGHFGEMVLPAGGYGPRCSDPDVHKGDGALYCVDGPVTVNLVDAEESFVLEPEDTFFLPAGTKYQLVNFENKPVKVVFAITEL